VCVCVGWPYARGSSLGIVSSDPSSSIRSEVVDLKHRDLSSNAWIAPFRPGLLLRGRAVVATNAVAISALDERRHAGELSPTPRIDKPLRKRCISQRPRPTLWSGVSREGCLVSQRAGRRMCRSRSGFRLGCQPR
jgi:hypothetical protein